MISFSKLKDIIDFRVNIFILVVGLVFSVIGSVLASGVIYACAENIEETDKNDYITISETDEFRFEACFGVKRCVKKGNEAYLQYVASYSKDAGNIDNWKDGINLNEYNKYMESIRYVNGIITNTEVSEEYMINTYTNNKKLKVIFHNTSNIKDYTLNKPEDAEYIEKLNSNGETERIYSNGFTEVLIKVDATEDVVIAKEFNRKNFLLSMIQLTLLIESLLLIVIITSSIICINSAKPRKKKNENS